MISHQDLAKLVTGPAPYHRDGWIYELKYDGYRMLASHRGDDAKIISHRGNNFSDRFPEIIAELLTLPDVVLDTELVMLDKNGHPVFERLIRRSRLKKRISIEHGSRTDPAALFAFDLLQLKGKDVRTWPLVDRKALLKKTLARAKRVRYTDHVDDGQGLFKAAESSSLEGIVAKRADSPYRRGRTNDWVKIKTGAGRAIDVERAKWNER